MTGREASRWTTPALLPWRPTKGRKGRELHTYATHTANFECGTGTNK